MSMLRPLLGLALVSSCIVLVSCSEPGQRVAPVPVPEVDSLADLKLHFTTQNQLPYVVDTTLLFRVVNCDSLGTREVRQLDKNWFMHGLTEFSGTHYDLKEFFKIDSIKAGGTYAVWADSLEPGNTKSSNAYSLGKIVVDSNTTILLWALSTMSYEACPYSSSQAVYFSIACKGSITQTFILGEFVSAGDPPVSLQRTVSGKMNKDLTFELDVYEEGDEDMDLPEINVTREHYEFSIKDGKVSLVKEKKDPAVKAKRKPA